MISHLDQAQGLTAAQMNRKITKPLMERKRRQRINDSLSELKSLILDQNPGERESPYCGPSSASKLEKADILEMTVRYIRQKKRDWSQRNSFMSGYVSCASEIHAFLGGDVGAQAPPAVRERLEAHLRDKLVVSCAATTLGDLQPATCDLNSDGGSVCSDGESSVESHVSSNHHHQQLSPAYHMQLSPCDPASPTTISHQQQPSLGKLQQPSHGKSPSKHQARRSLPYARSDVQFSGGCQRPVASSPPTSNHESPMWRPW